MVWLTEVVLLGSSDTRLTEFNLNAETKILLELVLGFSKGAAVSLWQNFEEYAHSRGMTSNPLLIHKKINIQYVLSMLYCFAVRKELENGGFAGDCLLQTVCRCSLAALLKHTGLQDKAYWQDRSVTKN